MKIYVATLSPLHIGGSAILTAMDYISLDGWMYVISESRLSRRLAEAHLIDDFVETMSAKGRNFSLQQYLENKKLLNTSEIAQMSLYKTKLLSQLPKEIRPFIRDAFARPYIPGTSVKGAFRNAITYTILKNLPFQDKEKWLFQPVRKRLEKIVTDREEAKKKGNKYSIENAKKSFFQKYEKDLLQNYLKLDANAKGADPKYDLFRCLTVRDCTPFERDKLAVFPVKIYSARSSEKVKSTTIFAECVPANTLFEIEFMFNEKIWREFRQKYDRTLWGMNMDDFEAILRNPLSSCQTLCRDVLAYEREFCEAEFDSTEHLPPSADIRMGWGGGLLSATVFLLLDEDLRRQVRDLLFTDRPNAPAPKSRKIIQKQEKPFFSLGWLRVIPSNHN